MFLRRSSVFTIVAMLIWIVGCGERKDIKRVSFKEREPVSINKFANWKDSIKIAIGSMLIPKERYAYYRKILKYIEGRIGRSVTLIERKSSVEVNDLLRIGEVDVAFVCSMPYVESHDDFGAELLVVPQINGKIVYQAYIIVGSDSPVENLDGLRGKNFSFVDPHSHAGKAIIDYMLANIGENPDRFFSNYSYSYAHAKSIEAVAYGLVDGAAVSSIVWEYMNYYSPEITSRTRVIKKSSPYGIPPVVVKKGIGQDLKAKLKKVFLNMHRDEVGKEILKGLRIDRFVESDNSAYDSIREVRSIITGL